MDNAEFKLHRLSNYSDEALLSELHRVASIAVSGPFTRKLFNEHSRAAASTVIRRFGGWQQALEVAGLSSRYGGQPVTERMRHQPGKTLTSDEVIEELRRVAAKLGRQDLTVEDFNSHAFFSVGTVRSHFMSWRRAIEAAGLAARPNSARYSEDECHENLLQVWSYLKRPPCYREMNSAPSKVGGKAYLTRWGTWVKALEAFITRVNKDITPQPPVDEIFAAPTKLKVDDAAKEDDGRVRLGIRYRALVRDNFKCVLCGASPAVNPLCRLHIDHIHPYSKGGATTFENLRTLCESCNIGKSNLTIESAANCSI